MSHLSMVEARLPPGFRFHPRDEELICDYLMKRVANSDHPPLMIEVDLNKCEPWDIPETACVGGKEWYFYSQRDRKYATGLRTNRATVSGYWKATGKDRPVVRKGSQLVGMRKTLVFYQGRAPKGRKTEWVMHEFRLEGPLGPPKSSSPKEDWVLCRVFYKNRSSEVAAAKQGSEGSGGYDDFIHSSSSSLPPLMEPYITFDQTQSTTDHHEQVPCFSIFSHNQTSPTFSNLITTTHNIQDPNFSSSNSSTNKLLPPSPFGDVLVGTYLTSPPPNLSCEQNVLKAVLNHLTSKIEISSNPNNLNYGSPSFGEGSSAESFLSEVGGPSSAAWNNY